LLHRSGRPGINPVSLCRTPELISKLADVVDAPVPLRVAVAEIALARKAAVRDLDEVAGDFDGDVHALDLVAPLIFIWPPQAGADAFAGGVDQGVAGDVLLEGEDAEAAGLDGVPE